MLSAIILIPIALIATYLGGVWFLTLVALVALIAGYEYFRLLRQGGYDPVWILGLLAIVGFYLEPFWPQHQVRRGTLALFCLLALAYQVFRGNRPKSLSSWGLTVAGTVYIGWSSQHFVTLRALEKGLYWIILVFGITWICDSAAYFIGKARGEHPFFAKISPHKTVEGAISGVVFGLAASLIIGLFIPIPWFHALGLGLVGSLGSTFGDLSESVVKRQVDVKDSSNLIPGHGGMLDRIDSLLFNVVLIYYYVYWILGIR